MNRTTIEVEVVVKVVVEEEEVVVLEEEVRLICLFTSLFAIRSSLFLARSHNFLICSLNQKGGGRVVGGSAKVDENEEGRGNIEPLSSRSRSQISPVSPPLPSRSKRKR